MSDFYLCEHKERCCGTCVRAAKTENNKLESQLSQVQGELERFKTDNSYLLGIQDGGRHVDFNLQVERDALKAEVERLHTNAEALAKAQTRDRLLTDSLQKEVQRLRGALQNIKRDFDICSFECDCGRSTPMKETDAYDYAKQALSSNDGHD